MAAAPCTSRGQLLSVLLLLLLAVAKLEMSFIGFANYKKLGYKLK
jgi:hypothetical protein